jgi:excisionase family DNA binding protein
MNTQKDLTPRALVSVEEACTQLGCGPTYVRGKIKSGELPAVKLGSRTMISPAAIAAFVAQLPPAQSPAQRSPERPV